MRRMLSPYGKAKRDMFPTNFLHVIIYSIESTTMVDRRTKDKLWQDFQDQSNLKKPSTGFWIFIGILAALFVYLLVRSLMS